MIKTFPGGKMKCLTFSYDDAGIQDIQLIKLFDQYNLKGTFNINSAQIQKDGPYWREDYNRLTSEVLTEVYKNHEIAGHTCSHPDLTVLGEEDIFKEIHNDRLELERITGRGIRGFAYPFGTYNQKVVDQLDKTGICYGRTVKSTGNFNMPEDFLRWHPTCHDNDKALSEYIEKFLADDDELKLFYIWGHSWELDEGDRWERMASLCRQLSGRDDIWYATNIEIYDYINSIK